MKYIIMADGKGTRWNNYKGIPKHLLKINGETLLFRIVRQLKEREKAEIIITSHDKRYEVKGAKRYEPINNVLEIDRFTEELIENDVCFLYGDTYYTDAAIDKIIKLNNDDILFFGNTSIVAIKVSNADIFNTHIKRVRELYLAGKIKNCAGWQVYQSFQRLPFTEKVIKEKFILVDDKTTDYDTPSDYEKGEENAEKVL